MSAVSTLTVNGMRSDLLAEGPEAAQEPDRLWSVWQAGSLMDATINAHPSGYEVRVYMGGDNPR